uniref:SLC12A transporter C-terminal domain-containing protein n=1 Tax=Strigamia maritima TaxID=126957 RepID=T1IQU6_STRMM
MAHLLGIGKKRDEYELGFDSPTMDLKESENSRFMVSNVHDNPAFEDSPIDDDEDDPKSSEHLDHHTTYIKTLQRLTREVLPHMDLYRDARDVHRLSRPSLDELRQHETVIGKKRKSIHGGIDDGGVKFGWIIGVMIRCLLNIWGPIMFIRLTYIIGRCGIIQALLVIALSDVIVVITGLSISAISTNGLVKGGGTYYLISRSLGPEYGGSIGLIFSFANAMAVAMHTVGFAESLKDMLKKLGLFIVDADINDMRIIGCVTACVLICIIMIGMEWEQKAQVFLLVVLLVAITDVIVGSFLPTDEEKGWGFVGWSSDVASKNLDSDYRGDSFFAMFSVFFPATTGILAGANISGDLKDPSKAIPRGTLLAIVLSTITYVLFVIIAGCTVYRDATGSFEDYLNGNLTYCPTPDSCKFGLQNNYQIMEVISANGYLVYAGCFAATLSSALACFVSAPKIFQALANDKIYPGLEWFGKGYGKGNEPIRSYLLALLIAVVFILIADFNIIAPIISNFFMAAYCLINFACFHAALAKSPGFRPGFRFWNMWVSLIGALLSMAVMFIMNWQTALGTFFICFFLYLYLIYKKPDVNWGSSQQAITYQSALKAVQELVQVEDHVKNYRSHIICMTGPVHSRPALLDLGYLITKHIGLLICGQIIKKPPTYRERQEIAKNAQIWLNERKLKAFHTIIEDTNLAHGAKALFQAAGVGKLKPNMLLMGFMNNWQNRSAEEITEYFDTIHVAFDLHLAVGILRVEQGLDFSQFTNTESVNTGLINGKPPMNREVSALSVISTASSNNSMTIDIEKAINNNPAGKSKKKDKNKEDKAKKEPQPPVKEIPKEVLKNIDVFRSNPDNKDKGTIDVWWLYDDGGLTLLLPYIFTTRKFFNKSHLRVFSLGNKDHEIDQQQLNLASLLGKFRINYKDVTVLPDISKKPKEHSIREFELLVSKFRQQENNPDQLNDLTISENEYHAMQTKTQRYIRIRELLLQHSRNAHLVVVTMPLPKKNRVSAPLYMSWLDTLTRDMPPTLLVRGNQTSVLTFYS